MQIYSLKYMMALYYAGRLAAPVKEKKRISYSVKVNEESDITKREKEKEESGGKERYNHEACIWRRVGVGVRSFSGRSCNQCSIVGSGRPALLVPCRGFTALG